MILINALMISVALLMGIESKVFAADKETPNLVSNNPLFHYQPSSDFPFLEVNLEGEKWFIKTAKASDIDFLNRVFLDQDIMKLYGSGPSIDSKEVLNRTLNLWLPRFEAGQPHGGLIVWSKEEGVPVGFVIGGLTNKPGVAGLSYAYLPSVWGKGIGSDVIKKFVEQWGPEVRRLGLGSSENESSLTSAFCCYNGEPLSRFEAVVSPDNGGSIKILLKNNFQNWPIDEAPLLDLSKITRDMSQSLENNILDFILSNNLSFSRGRYYKLIDFEGMERTFSMPDCYERIRYHLEYLF